MKNAKAKAMATSEHLAGIEVTTRQIPERLLPDERHQFLMPGGFTIEGDQWAEYDSWGLELACKLITLGYPVDLNSMVGELKDWPLECEVRDRFSSMTTVFCWARAVAESSVAAGIIKDPDTPASWVTWARSKGYAVEHLLPALKVGAGGTAAETPEERRERLKKRCNELKTSNVRAWKRQTADEEGVSVQRLDEIVNQRKKAKSTKPERFGELRNFQSKWQR